MKKDTDQLTFWEHLDALRGTIIRSLVAIAICMIAAFYFKTYLFDYIVLAPKDTNFISYRVLCRLAEWLGCSQLCSDSFSLSLININLSGQFIMHFNVAFWTGFIVAFPYILYELWKFIAPALYANEQKTILRIFVSGSLLFFIGVLISYFIIFPITIRFLGGYEVSTSVENQITLQSYLATLTILTLCMGLIFELPIVIYFLSSIGLVTKQWLRHYRRWAIILIMILAAIITPTSDPFTMIVVCIPLFLLYEVGILVCKK